MKTKKKILGIICASILLIAILLAMFLFKSARIGISIGLIISGLAVGATGGLSK